MVAGSRSGVALMGWSPSCVDAQVLNASKADERDLALTHILAAGESYIRSTKAILLRASLLRNKICVQPSEREGGRRGGRGGSNRPSAGREGSGSQQYNLQLGVAGLSADELAGFPDATPEEEDGSQGSGLIQDLHVGQAMEEPDSDNDDRMR